MFLLLVFTLFVDDISETNMIGVTKMYHLYDDTFVILHKRDGNQVSIYDASKDEVILGGIPSGKGPGESLGLVAFYHDEENQKFIFSDEIGSILVTDYSLVVKAQKQLGKINLNSLTRIRNHYVAGTTTMLRPGLQDSVTVAIYINEMTLDIEKELKFRFQDLLSPDIENLDKLMMLFLNSNVFNHNNELFLSFKQYPNLFTISADYSIMEVAKFTEIETFQIVRRGELWGTRMAAICNSFQKVESHLICWNGNSEQEIHPGYYMIDLKSKSPSGPHLLQSNIEFNGSSTGVLGQNSLIMTEAANVLANGNFLYRVLNPKFSN